MFVSTTYSNFANKIVKEKVYDHKLTPNVALNMLKDLDDANINKLDSKIVHPFPNTYTFSKGITEVLVEPYAKNFSTGIFRPAGSNL